MTVNHSCELYYVVNLTSNVIRILVVVAVAWKWDKGYHMVRVIHKLVNLCICTERLTVRVLVCLLFDTIFPPLLSNNVTANANFLNSEGTENPLIPSYSLCTCTYARDKQRQWIVYYRCLTRSGCITKADTMGGERADASEHSWCNFQFTNMSLCISAKQGDRN